MATARWLLAWLAGVAVATVAGSVIQTQLNVARIAALDGAVEWSRRLETTLADLAGFAPTWGMIVALGMLIAMAVAGLLVWRWQRWLLALHTLAGFAAVAVALAVMDAMLPVTALAAARSATGVTLLCLAGALGGWCHAMIAFRPGRNRAG